MPVREPPELFGYLFKPFVSTMQSTYNRGIYVYSHTLNLAYPIMKVKNRSQILGDAYGDSTIKSYAPGLAAAGSTKLATEGSGDGAVTALDAALAAQTDLLNAAQITEQAVGLS